MDTLKRSRGQLVLVADEFGIIQGLVTPIDVFEAIAGEFPDEDETPDIVSDGIANGSLQIPGNGQPLLLLADRGTTGGYPKIATVITADLGRAAQTPVGTVIKFQAVPIEAAQAETKRFMQLVHQLPQLCQPIGQEGISSEMLFAGHGAGHATNALDPQT
jgi:CBS domain containing-hemolysin-like protein